MKAEWLTIGNRYGGTEGGVFCLERHYNLERALYNSVTS